MKDVLIEDRCDEEVPVQATPKILVSIRNFHNIFKLSHFNSDKTQCGRSMSLTGMPPGVNRGPS